MPTYRNTTENRIRVTDSNGNEKILIENESVATNRYYDITGLTKVSDEPYLNPVAEYNILTFVSASSQTITLTSPDIAKIRIQKADGTFNVYLQSSSNTPAILQNWTIDDYPVDIVINGRCDSIVVESTGTSGTIQVIELLER